MSENTKQHPVINLTFTETETREQISINLPPELFLRVYALINERGLDLQEAYLLAYLGAWVATEGHFSDQQRQRIELAIRGMQKENWDPASAVSTENILLSLSYHFLQTQQATYAELADIAATTLGTSISPDAWRRRLNRWIKDQGRPPLKGRRGRPAHKKNEQTVEEVSRIVGEALKEAR